MIGQAHMLETLAYVSDFAYGTGLLASCNHLLGHNRFNHLCGLDHFGKRA